MELLDKRLRLIKPKEIVSEEELLTFTDEEMIIKVDAIGVCSTDCKNYLYFNSGYFGHELVGSIITPYQDFQKDDRVVIMHRHGCNGCSACISGNYNQCLHPVQIEVGFKKYVKIKKEQAHYCLYKIPSGTCKLEAVFSDSVACVIHALGMINIKSNEKVIILGSGFMSMIFYLIIRIHNANVYVYSRNPHKKAMFNDFGLENFITEQIEDYNDNFDVCIDTTGDSTLLKNISKVLKGNCRCLCFARLDDRNNFYNAFREKEIKLLFSKHHNPDDVTMALNMLKDGALSFKNVLKKYYSLNETESIIKAMLQGNLLRGVIQIND